MTAKRKILFIVQHRWDRSPGQRYRCEQYIPYLKEAGFECVYAPLLRTKEEDQNFYAPGNYFAKLWLFVLGFWRRWQDVRRASQFDIIFIYREAFMTGTTWFERQMKKSGARIIFDFDDAIWNHDVSAGNKALGWLKRPEKVNEIMGLSDMVIAGNPYLARYASAFNPETTIFPSTIDLAYYKVPEKKEDAGRPVIIGWSGSLTTIEHFKTIVPVLRKLKEKYGSKVAFRVFGIPEYENPALGISGIGWTPENEVAEIAAFDIGIMPLPDNEWTKGKCGMKGLQYMALEVATVMSAVGVNTDIITDGSNGFLAGSEQEWTDKLSLLIENKNLCERMGKAGRRTIEEHYSCQALQERYVNFFRNLARN